MPYSAAAAPSESLNGIIITADSRQGRGQLVPGRFQSYLIRSGNRPRPCSCAVFNQPWITLRPAIFLLTKILSDLLFHGDKLSAKAIRHVFHIGLETADDPVIWECARSESIMA